MQSSVAFFRCWKNIYFSSSTSRICMLRFSRDSESPFKYMLWVNRVGTEVVSKHSTLTLGVIAVYVRRSSWPWFPYTLLFAASYSIIEQLKNWFTFIVFVDGADDSVNFHVEMRSWSIFGGFLRHPSLEINLKNPTQIFIKLLTNCLGTTILTFCAFGSLPLERLLEHLCQ